MIPTIWLLGILEKLKLWRQEKKISSHLELAGREGRVGRTERILRAMKLLCRIL